MNGLQKAAAGFWAGWLASGVLVELAAIRIERDYEAKGLTLCGNARGWLRMEPQSRGHRILTMAAVAGLHWFTAHLLEESRRPRVGKWS